MTKSPRCLVIDTDIASAASEKDTAEHQERVQAWQDHRNEALTTITWRFTTADARIKLKRLYPSLEKTSSSVEANEGSSMQEEIVVNLV